MTQALTASEVAQRLGVSRNTVAKWTKSGLIPVWFNTDEGRPIYADTVIEAHQRRTGELAAEQSGSAA